MENYSIDILVIGAGLSGLLATWQLSQAGQDVLLLEGRERIGGRAYTVGTEAGYDCDLGPSWFWSGQPLVLSLLQHFDIPYFEQHAAGDVLTQSAKRKVLRLDGPSPMAGARRIKGGVSRLTQAIASQIPTERLLLSHSVTALQLTDDNVTVTAKSPTGYAEIHAKQVALAIPPRLAASLSWSPKLSAETDQQLNAPSTWMSGHSKFFAVYEIPFWRDAGLCGSAMSQCGPLIEIHDASPQNERGFSLMGFVGLDGPTRATLGAHAIQQQALQQLTELFGPYAANPIQTYFQDWTQEPLTASFRDHQPQTRLPDYGLDIEWDDAWQDKIALISSETSFDNGGLIEGALEAGLAFATQFRDPSFKIIDEPTVPHKASMDWGWLKAPE